MTPDLFGHPELNKPSKASKSAARAASARRSADRRLAQMHAMYGKAPDGQTCKGCVHLVHFSPGAKTFLKCRLFRVSRCEATDWRAKWPACGKFKEFA